MLKLIYIMVGMLALLLGIVGTVLPVLPTTPFLLITLFCFTKSSKRLNTWFQKTRFYKKYLEEYERDKALTKKKKLCIQLLVACMVTVSFVAIDNSAMRIVLIAALLIHNYIFIFRIPTKKIDSK